MDFQMLKELKEETSFDETFFINREFHVNDTKGLILALTRKNTELSLWLLGQKEGIENEEERKKKPKKFPLTKREKLRLLSQQRSRQNQMLNLIHKVELWGKDYQINSVGMLPFDETSAMCLFTIEHLLKDNIDSILWNTYNWNELFYCQVTFKGEYRRLPKKKNQELNLRLNFQGMRDLDFVPKKITLCVDQEKVRTLSLIDSATKEKIPCYINKLSLYDPWSKEEESQWENPEYQKKALKHVTMEEFLKIKQDYYENMKSFCPEGLCIPVLEYESEDFFSFHTSAFLDQKEEPPKNSSTSMMFLMKPKQTKGKHGLPMHCATLEAVDRETKELSVEVFSGTANQKEIEISLS